MKSIAAVLFTALSLVACVADERELGPIDKESESESSRAELDHTVDPGLSERLDEVVGGPRRISGLNDNLSERAPEGFGPRPVTSLDDRLAQHSDDIRGPRGVDSIDDRLAQHSDDIRGPRDVDGIDEKLQELIDVRGADDIDLHGQLGEWAEEIVINGRQYTLVHVEGGHKLLDLLGFEVAEIRYVNTGLPQR